MKRTESSDASMDGTHAAAMETASALLEANGAAAIAHPGGTLLAHLQRTAYGTDGFSRCETLVSPAAAAAYASACREFAVDR